jgi:nitrogen fixation protein NifB
MNLDHHPCFNIKAHKTFGRVHLPVAPRCNIQCKFCNRKFDCVNESRPGVTSAVLTPLQAMLYLNEVVKQKPNIRVVGIAGPGDPFANAKQTLETFELVRKTYPDLLLCVASNGLNVLPYIDDLARLKVSHVTLTVNAINPEVGANIYSWMRIGKKVVRAVDGARILLDRQMEAITGLKERGILIKVNTILLPEINDDHIEDVARAMGELDVDIFNCMPYYPNSGSALEHLPEPTSEQLGNIRKNAAKYVLQMHHCTRCRADAVGLLGEKQSPALRQSLVSCQNIVSFESLGKSNCKSNVKEKPYVAVASREGVLVNQHLGEAYQLLIFRNNGNDEIEFVEQRTTPEPGGSNRRWQSLSKTLSDCRTLLVSGIGGNPRKVLEDNGIDIYEVEGVIIEAVKAIYEKKSLKRFTVCKIKSCGTGCGGNAMGCG